MDMKKVSIAQDSQKAALMDRTASQAKTPADIGGKDKFVKRMNAIAPLTFVQGEDAYPERLTIESDGLLSEFFGKKGIPMNTAFVFIGIPNQGKSFLAAALGARMANSPVGNYGKVMYVETEPGSIEGSVDFEKNMDSFIMVRPKDLTEMAALVQNQMGNHLGIDVSCLVLDSISEVAEDSKFLPDRPQDMECYRERSKFVRIIEESLRKYMIDAENGNRKPFIVFILSHLSKIIRPDQVAEEDVIEPHFDERTGKVTSGYIIPGSTANLLLHLVSHVFIFRDVSYSSQKKTPAGTKKVTVIRVTPWKSRRTSKFTTASFKITDNGVE